MDQFKTLQEFITAWMDELWWSMRDRVGALSIIESLQNSWLASGRKVGELAKAEGMNLLKTVETGNAMFGRSVKTTKDTVIVNACPIWNRILKGNLEYGLRCEEFICAPYLTGIKEALGGKEARVETNLRLNHVARARLEYKLSKLRAASSTDSKTKPQIDELEKQLANLPKEPACIFQVK
ncbi:MAG: hypothetical protein Q6364_11245 [Candidatus Hermodarchaeota archaeon]|jgi:hypothetical protein|nr:hypothetical protein [Candidatus Hermodarchaeota archaeon]